MERVGVRELRQNLSVYLRRVQAGESLEVTERGKPVAVLTPLGAGTEQLERQIRAGRIRPAPKPVKRFSVPAGTPSDAGSRALAAERSEH